MESSTKTEKKITQAAVARRLTAAYVRLGIIAGLGLLAALAPSGTTPTAGAAHAAAENEKRTTVRVVRGAPRAAQGKWRMTLAPGTNYYRTSAGGVYAGPGSGGAQTYHFLPDGTYRFTNYVRTRTGSQQIESYTWEDGVVMTSGDRMVLRPTGGKYRVIGSQSKQGSVTRPMRPEERSKNVRSIRWQVEGGTLHLGRTTDHMTDYRKAK